MEEGKGGEKIQIGSKNIFQHFRLLMAVHSGTEEGRRQNIDIIDMNTWLSQFIQSE